MSDMIDDENMQALLEKLGDPALDDEGILNEVLLKYPEDPRLHFLKGSTFAESGRLIEAHAALSQAVKLAPDFHNARFQLGFFQLTSGESDNALKTWARLDGLPKDQYLRIFVIGLRHLIRDELPECEEMLKKGISLNTENPPLNTDMQLIISQIRPLMQGKESSEAGAPASEAEDAEAEASLTSILLQQSNTTKH